MTDNTLCTSTTCPARADCRRNKACPTALPPDALAQWYAYWHPEAGYSCPGFWDGRDREVSQSEHWK